MPDVVHGVGHHEHDDNGPRGLPPPPAHPGLERGGEWGLGQQGGPGGARELQNCGRGDPGRQPTIQLFCVL